MMQKLEKVLDLAVEALELYLGRKNPQSCPECARPMMPVAANEAAAIGKPRKTRTPKAEPAATAAAVAAAASPFAPQGGDAKLSPEDAVEAGRRGQEVMGLFIRRYLKASPTGLERAKKIINDTLGLPRVPATAWKLEDFKPEDWLALTPKFEAELDKADPKA